VVGCWLQILQPQVLPPYFAARKKNPGPNIECGRNLGLLPYSITKTFIAGNNNNNDNDNK
jgi:hypothetical protein